MKHNMSIVSNNESIAIDSKFKWRCESLQFPEWNVRSNHAKEIGNPFLRSQITT